MTTSYFVPRCLLKRCSVKVTKVLENSFTSYSSNDLRLWHPESSSAVTLLLHADWIMLKNASNQGGANSVTVLSARNPGCGCWSLRKLHFSKIIWRLALGFSMDLQLNATRRSINLSVCLVFDLEVGRFKFLGENLLGAGERVSRNSVYHFFLLLPSNHSIPGVQKNPSVHPFDLTVQKKRTSI